MNLTLAAPARVPLNPHDGYDSDAEFASEITCTDCGLTSSDALTCDPCGTIDCCNVRPPRELCDDWPGGNLCDDCCRHFTCAGRCPSCDPGDR